MPGSNSDEVMADSDETPDWTGRAKGKSSPSSMTCTITDMDKQPWSFYPAHWTSSAQMP